MGSRQPALRSAGFTLIEVLIALLVISVGLLSVASLQLLSKRSNYDAAQRTTAANLAQDLLERMRSNSTALVDYLPAGDLGGGSLGGAPAVDCGDPDLAVPCTAQQLAAYDLWQWERHLDGALETNDGKTAKFGGLVAPAACIDGPAGGGPGMYSIAIAWRGMTDSVNPGASDCGEGSGDYGAGDTYRRVLVVQTYLSGA